MLGPATLLKSPRLLIRHGRPDDISAILAYYAENAKYLAPFEPLKPSKFYTRQYWEIDLAQRIEDTKAGRSLKLFIFLQEEPQPLIGTLNFSNCIRNVSQSCTVGYSLGEAYQGKGYMSEALQTGIKYMFTKMQFHRISANYIPHNKRSGKLLKRLGFAVEGYARDYLYINGQWQDHVLTSLVNPASNNQT